MNRPVAEAAPWSEATRRLCVGSMLDEGFARRVIRELSVERNRAVAPSYGIDLVPVVLHCLKAEQRRLHRDIILTGVLVVVGVFSRALLLTLVAILVRTVYRRAADASPTRGGRKRRLSGSVVFLFLLVASAIAALQGYGGAELSGYGEGETVLGLSSPFVFLGLLAVIVSTAVCFWSWYKAREYAGEALSEKVPADRRREAFHTLRAQVHLTRAQSERLQEIEQAQYTPVTVYSPLFDAPFVGAGRPGQLWSFAVNLARAGDQRNEGPRRFTVQELQESIAGRFEALRTSAREAAAAQDAEATRFLAGLAVTDHIFVDGVSCSKRDAVQIAEHLRQRGFSWYMNRARGPVRHFKCVRVESWGAELVRSVFVHASAEGDTLYVEFSPCLLPPIRPGYRLVDAFPRVTRAEIRLAAGQSLKGSVPALLDAPINLARRLFPEPSDEERARKEGKMLIVRDHGARVSVRELGARAKVDHYFQHLDSDKQLKIIEVQLLDTIIDFLEEHNVATGELRQQRTHILQQSVYNFGAVNNQINSLGDGAKANIDTK